MDISCNFRVTQSLRLMARSPGYCFIRRFSLSLIIDFMSRLIIFFYVSYQTMNRRNTNFVKWAVSQLSYYVLKAGTLKYSRIFRYRLYERIYLNGSTYVSNFCFSVNACRCLYSIFYCYRIYVPWNTCKLSKSGESGYKPVIAAKTSMPALLGIPSTISIKWYEFSTDSINKTCPECKPTLNLCY